MARSDRIEENWGIDPVPERLRVLGMLDTGLLWGNLGVSLLVIVAGAALVPALSLPDALFAIVLGCAIGNTMLGIAGTIGADARVPGMVLLRAPLGKQGSYLPTGVNVLQGLGWSVFELLIIATAAAALSDELVGFRAQWLWTIVFGTFALALALLGPIGFVRRFVRRVAVWAVPVALVYLTWWTLDGTDLRMLWDDPGTGGLSVWQGTDIVVAITVSWAPLAADFALLVTETDEAFANTYSAAVSLQNLVPQAPQTLLVALVAAAATTGALVIDLVSYQSFLLLLGSVFVPLFAVLLADWLAAGRHYTTGDVFGAPAWRPGLIAAWIAGFVLYQWLFPTGPSWWVDLVENLDPPAWGVGATVPSFIVSFAVAGLVAAFSRRSAAGAAPA